MRKILGVFEVFLGILVKTKEKKDREVHFKVRKNAILDPPPPEKTAPKKSMKMSKNPSFWTF